MTIEFVCADCDFNVISIGPVHNAEHRCAGCQWIAELPDPAYREGLRRELAARGIIGTPKRAGLDAYRCPSCGASAQAHCCGNREYRPGCAWHAHG